MKQLLIISGDIVGTKMAGPGMRYFNIAKIMIKNNISTHLISPNSADAKFSKLNPDLRISPYNGAEGINKYINELNPNDLIFCQHLPLQSVICALNNKVKIVYDLYNPLTIEAVSQNNQNDKHFDGHYIELLNLTSLYAASGSYFLASNDRQRDLWMGTLSRNGILRDRFISDRNRMSDFIGLLPFGISSTAPKKTQPALRGVINGINENSKIILWTGGIWDWFDPLTPIKAVGKLSNTMPDIKLVFYGTKHPNPLVEQRTMADKARLLSDKLKLTNKHVFFLEGWVDSELRQNYLLESDIAISSHFDTLETRFSFRTRVLDHLWAELPTICTGGDFFADEIKENELGLVARYENVDDWVESIKELLVNTDLVKSIKLNISRYRKRFFWDNTCLDLINYVKKDKSEPIADLSIVNEYIDLSSMGLLKKDSAKVVKMVEARKNLSIALTRPKLSRIKNIHKYIVDSVKIEKNNKTN